MICANCGKEIADGSKFCGFCGNAVPVVAAPVAEQPAVEAAPVAEQPVVEAAPVAEQPAAVPMQGQPAPVQPTVMPMQGQSVPVQGQPMPMQGQPMPMQGQPAPVPGAVPPPVQPKKKKGKTGLVVCIIVLLVVLAAGGAGVFLWMNRPANKIEAAFAEGDLDRAIELFEGVKGKKDIEAVQAQAMDYAVQMTNEYMDETMDYDTAIDTLRQLYDSILEDDLEVEDMIDQIERVQISRNTFELAETYKESGDYLAAIDEYELVIDEDAHYYDLAQEAMAECEENYCQEALEEAQDFMDEGSYAQAKTVLEDALYYFYNDELSAKLDEVETAIAEEEVAAIAAVTGTWSLQVDMGAYLAQEMGDDFADFESSFFITLYLDLNSDSSYRMYINETELGESLDLFLDDFITYTMNMMYQMFEEQGISKKDADKLVEDVYGASMEDYIREMIESELDYAEMASDLETTGYYTLDGNKIYWDSTGVDYDYFTVSGDTLTFEAADGNTDEIFPGMQYPFSMTRVQENAEPEALEDTGELAE